MNFTETKFSYLFMVYLINFVMTAMLGSYWPWCRDVQQETMSGKCLGNSLFPGNGMEKFEPRELPSHGNFPWLGKFPCHKKFRYSRGHSFLIGCPNCNLKRTNYKIINSFKIYTWLAFKLCVQKFIFA